MKILLIGYSDGFLLNSLDHSISNHSKKYGNQKPFGYPSFNLWNTGLETGLVTPITGQNININFLVATI